MLENPSWEKISCLLACDVERLHNSIQIRHWLALVFGSMTKWMSQEILSEACLDESERTVVPLPAVPVTFAAAPF